MEISFLGGCVCTKGGQGESGLGSRMIVGSLSNSRLTTCKEKRHTFADVFRITMFAAEKIVPVSVGQAHQKYQK